MRHWVLFALIASPAMVSATTLKTIVLDGDLSDFEPTDRLPDDPPGDSTLAPNEVGVLYVNWDLTYLYLGFDFRSASLAEVQYYIQSTGTGATDLCSFGSLATAGTLSEPADMVVAFASNESSHVFTLASGFPVQDTSSPSIRSFPPDGLLGSAEVGIPWASLFPAGATTVPAGATIRIVGVVRTRNAGDAIVDVNPDQTLNGQTCAGTPPTISRFHTIHIDADGDGSPDDGWDAGPDVADACLGLVCTPLDECHLAGVCEASTGMCTSPEAPDGTPCPGGTCTAGSCPGVDAGMSLDASVRDSGPAPTDAATRLDGSTPRADAGSITTSSGCGCRLAPARALPAWMLLWIALVLCRFRAASTASAGSSSRSAACRRRARRPSRRPSRRRRPSRAARRRAALPPRPR